jgi:hypothetical protein
LAPIGNPAAFQFAALQLTSQNRHVNGKHFFPKKQEIAQTSQKRQLRQISQKKPKKLKETLMPKKNVMY